MAADFIIAPQVELDISEAYGWYEGHRSGLGEEFLSCVDACIQRIRRTPDGYAKVHEEYRRALVRRFPYSNCKRVAKWCVSRTLLDLKSGVGIAPNAEKDVLAPDFFRPLSVAVRVERKVRIGLGRFFRRPLPSRIRHGRSSIPGPGLPSSMDTHRRGYFSWRVS